MSPDDIPPGESDGEGDTCDVRTAREPTDEELAGLWPRFRRYGPAVMMERARAPLPPGALEFARAVRAWTPEADAELERLRAQHDECPLWPGEDER